MIKSKFVVKNKNLRYLFPKDYSTSNLLSRKVMEQSSIEDDIKPRLKQLKKESSKNQVIPAKQESLPQISTKHLLDKSVGSDSPIFKTKDSLPSIIKPFIFSQNPSSKTPAIHSLQSRCLSQKSFPYKHPNPSTPIYTQPKTFQVLLSGKKFS